jgi:hypothetical protein
MPEMLNAYTVISGAVLLTSRCCEILLIFTVQDSRTKVDSSCLDINHSPFSNVETLLCTYSHTRPSLDPIVSQINQVPVFTIYFYKTFQYSSLIYVWSSKWLPPLGFPTQILYAFITCFMLYQFNTHLNIFCHGRLRLQNMSLSLCNKLNIIRPFCRRN